MSRETGPHEGHRARSEASGPWKPEQQLNVTRGIGVLPVGRGPESQASRSPRDTGYAHSQAEGEGCPAVVSRALKFLQFLVFNQLFNSLQRLSALAPFLTYKPLPASSVQAPCHTQGEGRVTVHPSFPRTGLIYSTRSKMLPDLDDKLYRHPGKGPPPPHLSWAAGKVSLSTLLHPLAAAAG